MNFLLATVCLLFYTTSVSGHGRLLQPPGRSSLWRFSGDARYQSAKHMFVPNYNDNQLFCGGFSTQWYTNGGKCGVCGDSFSDAMPRANEAGGTYGMGIIAEKYESGDKINIYVELTAYHQGYFEFRLCPNNDIERIVTQECLNQNLLVLGNGETKYYPKKDVKHVNVDAYLPEGLTCSQCVLQWRYHTGNSWGVDSETGESGVGLGPQEEFYGCSDIEIGSGDGFVPPPPPTTTEASPQTTTTMEAPTTTRSKPFFPSTSPSASLEPDSTTTTTTTTKTVAASSESTQAPGFLGPNIEVCTAENLQKDYIQYSCNQFIRCPYVNYPPTQPITCPETTVVNFSSGSFTGCDFKYNVPEPCGTKVP